MSSTAEHFDIASDLVREAVAYASIHPTEVDTAIRYSESIGLDQLREILPHIETFTICDESPHS